MLVVSVLACAIWVSGAARPTGSGGEPTRIGYTPAAVRDASAPRARSSIVGGSSASIAAFPFQVALYDPRAGSPAAGFFCGGVIIDATHVATAAHCVVGGAGTPGNIAVLAGSTTLNYPLDPGSVEDPVRLSSFDANYNPSSSDYDVALLTLERPLWSGSPPSANGVDTIASLPVEPQAADKYGNPNLTPELGAVASGWGDVNAAPSGAPSYPTTLRAVHMRLVSESLCEEQYAAIEQSITQRMICAGGGRSHVDTCYGDSGGPLVVDRDNPARPPGDYVLVGLVDFGNGCAQSGYAGVYTRVSDPGILSFLDSGMGRQARVLGTQAKHKKRKKRHRRRRH